MKIVIGLGNPGEKYVHTRHNAGFLAVNFFLNDHPAISCHSKFAAEICEIHLETQKILFVKPQTYMNNSGEAVGEICRFYNVNIAEDILVVHDEVDLPFGTCRVTSSSSAAGHNGIKDIIAQLASQDFHRLRIGVESRTDKKNPPTEAFVLQKFSDDEQKKLQEEILPEVKRKIETFLNT